jgi:hypothetical protein
MAQEDDKRRIGELEDTVKQRDQRLAELRDEVDELRELVTRLRERSEEYDSSIEAWCETFEMEMTEDGTWKWKRFWNEHKVLIDNYNALVRDWNKYLPLINGRTQPVGRPLAASEAQVAEVLKLRKRGRSLRGIADDTRADSGRFHS